MHPLYVKYCMKQPAITMVFRKDAGFFLGLAAKAAKTALPLAGFIGLTTGMTTEGSMKDKVLAGTEETVSNVMNPGKVVSNTAIWGAPVKLLGAMKVPGLLSIPAGMYGGMKLSEKTNPIFGIKDMETPENPFAIG